MKKSYPFKEIMTKANRPCEYTNRSFKFKSVNAALQTGLVQVVISDLGKVWRKENGEQYNLKVTAGGYMRRIFVKGEMAPGDVLRTIGHLLIDPKVQEVIKSSVHLRSSCCRKCSGRGIIPAFHYYCNGVCFDCGGTGMNLTNEKTTVKIHTA